ncbi:MAG: zf-TFIIB domain-containing protein [Nitrospiria bacterium]
MPLEEDLNKGGYNKEEAYFHALNKTLIEKIKKKGGSEEKCPHCDAVLETIEAIGIRASRCVSCLGIFLAKEAIESLLKSKEPRQFLSALLPPPS